MALKVPRRLQSHDALTVAHRHAPRHEKATAKRLGGKCTSGSGNQANKGDVRVAGIMRAELKCTKNQSFAVTRDMLHKIEIAAYSANEIPAMEIQFLNADGSIAGCYAVVPSEVLDRLVRC